MYSPRPAGPRRACQVDPPDLRGRDTSPLDGRSCFPPCNGKLRLGRKCGKDEDIPGKHSPAVVQELMRVSFGNFCENIALAVTSFDVQQSLLQKPGLMFNRTGYPRAALYATACLCLGGNFVHSLPNVKCDSLRAFVSWGTESEVYRKSVIVKADGPRTFRPS